MNFRFSTMAVLAAGMVLFSLMARQAALKGSAAANLKNGPDTPRSAEVGSTPVLVELFTSEGCSSCPPADALLSRLLRTQPVRGADIIALEEHVNYWDNLGWKDPFSSDAATARQSEYEEAFGGKEIYTPQMIVDGRTEFVGSSDSDALRAIRASSQSPKPEVQLSWGKDDTLAIHMEPFTNAGQGEGLQLFLVVAENMLHSDVKHGENSGRALEHNGVVRQLLPLGKIDATSSGFSSSVAVHPAREWNRANLRVVVFVQERRSRHVLAAAAIPFPS
ncbi:MAG TPA: DUF1223 domain-containing protein [Candidatus Acidoferrales bacterium]|nr:DUF1223 domain-containing protein [Candidatus Acidoferrales bacterium]